MESWLELSPEFFIRSAIWRSFDVKRKTNKTCKSPRTRYIAISEMTISLLQYNDEFL